MTFPILRARMAVMLCGCVILFAPGPIWAQSSEVQIQGVWRMDSRVRKSIGVVYNQRDLKLFVSDKRPDGTYPVITTFTIHAVADNENRLARPECEGKTECTYDDGSEGTGRLVGNKFYIDWINEAWIDDVLTITGNRMTGHDGNAPLDFVRTE